MVVALWIQRVAPPCYVLRIKYRASYRRTRGHTTENASREPPGLLVAGTRVGLQPFGDQADAARVRVERHAQQPAHAGGAVDSVEPSSRGRSAAASCSA